MPLTCSCDFEPEPGDWYYSGSKDYMPFPDRRRTRCNNPACGKLISPDDVVSRFSRVKCPYTEAECKIYGEDGEIPLAPHWLCEECADLYWSISDLGFCASPCEDLKQLAKDWNREYVKPATQNVDKINKALDGVQEVDDE